MEQFSVASIDQQTVVILTNTLFHDIDALLVAGSSSSLSLHPGYLDHHANSAYGNKKYSSAMAVLGEGQQQKSTE